MDKEEVDWDYEKETMGWDFDGRVFIINFPKEKIETSLASSRSASNAVDKYGY